MLFEIQKISRSRRVVRRSRVVRAFARSRVRDRDRGASARGRSPRRARGRGVGVRGVARRASRTGRRAKHGPVSRIRNDTTRTGDPKRRRRSRAPSTPTRATTMARAPATDGGDAASAFRARDDGARRAYNVEIPAAWQRESVDESLLRGHRSACTTATRTDRRTRTRLAIAPATARDNTSAPRNSARTFASNPKARRYSQPRSRPRNYSR